MGNKNTLPFVKNKEEILKNAATLNGYLKDKNTEKNLYAKELIRNGKCFVAISTTDGYLFFPSRFMGYVSNSMEAHIKMGEMKKMSGKTTRDGRKTNAIISEIIGELIVDENPKWKIFETEYKKFCKILGIVPSIISENIGIS